MCSTAARAARSGSGSLYTVEHFEAVGRRLAPGGVFCQWLPLHQLDLETLRTIVRSFSAVYPEGSAMLASNSLETPVLGLVARRARERFDADAIRERLARAGLPPRLSAIGLEDELAVLGSFVAGPDALRRFARDASANTNDRPLVAHLAPRITYAPDSRPGERLLALLRQLSIEPGELIAAPYDERLPLRLAAYWSARDRFIEAGDGVRPSTDVREMLAQVSYKGLPLFIGVETVVPGHEHTSMSVNTGQIPDSLYTSPLPTTPNGPPLPAGPPYKALGDAT